VVDFTREKRVGSLISTCDGLAFYRISTGAKSLFQCE